MLSMDTNMWCKDLHTLCPSLWVHTHPSFPGLFVPSLLIFILPSFPTANEVCIYSYLRPLLLSTEWMPTYTAQSPAHWEDSTLFTVFQGHFGMRLQCGHPLFSASTHILNRSICGSSSALSLLIRWPWGSHAATGVR